MKIKANFMHRLTSTPAVPELVLEGVEAAELERFCAELEAHEQAERALGPAMG